MDAALERRSTELARSNEHLQHFATLTSHDLRAPLRLVSSYLDLIAECDDDEDLHAAAEQRACYLQRAREGTERLRELIDGLLHYARAGTGTLEASESVSVEEALDRALTNLDELIRRRDAHIDAGPLPRVRALLIPLAQCLQNLLTNAIRYNDSTPPQVQVRAQRDGDFWRIEVQDNGRGVPSEEREEVFRMFRRGRDEDGLGGAGIGLAFCRRLVENFGGHIWIADTGQPGTTVRFTLQAAD